MTAERFGDTTLSLWRIGPERAITLAAERVLANSSGNGPAKRTVRRVLDAPRLPVAVRKRTSALDHASISPDQQTPWFKAARHVWWAALDPRRPTSAILSCSAAFQLLGDSPPPAPDAEVDSAAERTQVLTDIEQDAFHTAAWRVGRLLNTVDHDRSFEAVRQVLIRTCTTVWPFLEWRISRNVQPSEAERGGWPSWMPPPTVLIPNGHLQWSIVAVHCARVAVLYDVPERGALQAEALAMAARAQLERGRSGKFVGSPGIYPAPLPHSFENSPLRRTIETEFWQECVAAIDAVG